MRRDCGSDVANTAIVNAHDIREGTMRTMLATVFERAIFDYQCGAVFLPDVSSRKLQSNT
jgi:hypothetical protein